MFKGFNRIDIIDQSMVAARAAYNEGKISAEQMRERASRIKKIGSEVRRLQREQCERNKYMARSTRHINEIRGGLKNGALFVSIDTGFNAKTKELHTVGITTYRSGKFEIITYVVDKFAAGYSTADIFADDGTVLSHIRVVTLDEVLNITKKIYQEADYGIFHAAYKDMEILGLNCTTGRFFDTSYLSHRQIKGDTPSVGKLCDFYGIKTNNLHHSGVDSYYTMRVLIEQANDKRKVYSVHNS